MPANVPMFGIIPKHAVLINASKKNIQNKNPTKEKEKSLRSMNLQVKLAHVLAKRSVKYNMRVIFHRLYSSTLFDSGFDTISKNTSKVSHSRDFVELFCAKKFNYKNNMIIRTNT